MLRLFTLFTYLDLMKSVNLNEKKRDLVSAVVPGKETLVRVFVV